MTEPRAREHPDGTLTLWVDGHPYLLRESKEQQRGLYGGWSVVWRARAARFWLAGESELGRQWAGLADAAETLCRRVEERD